MNDGDVMGMMNSFYTHNPYFDLDTNLCEPTDLVPGISYYSSFACTCKIPASSRLPAPSKPWRLPELPQATSAWAHELQDFASLSPTSDNSLQKETLIPPTF